MSSSEGHAEALPEQAKDVERRNEVEHFKNMFALSSDDEAKLFMESLCPCKVNELAFDNDVDVWKIQADHLGALDDEISTEYLREQENMHSLNALLDGSQPADWSDPFNAITPDAWIQRAQALSSAVMKARQIKEEDAKTQYEYPFESVGQVLRGYQDLVEFVAVHPGHDLEGVLLNASKDVVEYLNYAQQLVQGPKKSSAHYWLYKGQGSLLPDGIKKLYYSMEFVVKTKQIETNV